MWKRYNFEGGIADPLVISWPKGIKAHGEIRHQYNHATDIVPTIYDCLGIELPDEVKGFTQIPLEGQSFRYSFENADAPTEKETGFFTMLGSRAIWHKGWKAVAVHPTIAGWGDFGNDRWELYDTTKDRTETHDLAAQYPEKVQELVDLWSSQAGMFKGLPIDDRTPVEILDRRRPQMSKPRDRYIYYPDCAEVPEPSSVNIRSRVLHDRGGGDDRHAGGQRGAVLARRALRRALAVHQGRQAQVRLQLRRLISRRWSSRRRGVPTGKHILSAAFVREGTDMPAHGTVTLYIDDKAVGEDQIKTQPGMFSLVGEGPERRQGPRRTGHRGLRRQGHFAFTGGTIKQVIVDVSGEPYVDLEKEAIAMMARE